MKVNPRTKEHNPTTEKNPTEKPVLGAPQKMNKEDDEHTKSDDPRGHDAEVHQPMTE
jgi:hypothetical protein